jgi:hypothetical protein
MGVGKPTPIFVCDNVIPGPRLVADRSFGFVAKAALRTEVYVLRTSFIESAAACPRTVKRDKNRDDLADATVRRRTGKAKQFFKEAIERGYREPNPFAGLPSTVNANEAKQFFVPAEWIEKCMEHCPSNEWRTILALAVSRSFRIDSPSLEGRQSSGGPNDDRLSLDRAARVSYLL